MPHDDDRPASSWTEPIDLVVRGSQPPEPPTTLGLLYPGLRHLVSAEPEGAKTWLALIACAEEIHAGHSVVWVDFEMGPAQVLSRLRDLGLADVEIRDRFVYLQPDEKLQDPAVLRELNELLELRMPSLVVVDAFVGALQLQGLDANSSVDIETFYRGIVDVLRSWGAAVVILDHLAKDRDTRGRWAIGSERKVGAADVHLGLEPISQFRRGHTGVVKVTVHKDRPGHLPRPRAGELHLHSDPDTGRVTWEIRPPETTTTDTADGWQPTTLMAKVSDHLARQTEPVTRTAITQAVGGRKAWVLKAISELIEHDHIAVDEAGRLTLTTPYTVPAVPAVPTRFPDGSGETADSDGSRFPPPQGGTGTGTDLGNHLFEELEALASEVNP